MSNLKKTIVIIVACIACFFMFFFASKFQKTYADKNMSNNSNIEQNVSENSDDDKSSKEDQNKENEEAYKSNKSESESIEEDDETKNNDKEDDLDSKSNDNVNVQNSDKNKENIKKIDDKSGKQDGKRNNRVINITQNSDSRNIGSLKNDINKAVKNNITSNDVSKKDNNKTDNSKTANSVEDYNFEIKDEVHNKVILNKCVEVEGKTVGEITCNLLDEAKINYRATGSSSTLYFASISGVAERKAGPLSGWTYYIKKKGKSNYFKPSEGCGQYVCQKGDKIIWKYLKDGLSN